MKTHLAALCVAFIAMFALSACGNASNEPNTNAAPANTAPCGPTPEERLAAQQAAVDALIAAFREMDIEKLKAQFYSRQRESVERRWGERFKAVIAANGTWEATADPLKAENGTPVLVVRMKISMSGASEQDVRDYTMSEEDGSWCFKGRP